MSLALGSSALGQEFVNFTFGDDFCNPLLTANVKLSMLAQSIAHLWELYWWQLYLASILLGFWSAIMVALLRNNNRAPLLYTGGIRCLLYLAATANAIVIALTVFGHYSSAWMGVCNLADHLLLFVVDGAVLALPLIASVFARGKGPDSRTLVQLFGQPRMVKSAIFAVSALYIACGVTKFLVHETIDFFHASGYSTTFFYFIATWEPMWGILILWRRTTNLALAALGIDMCGAIYTHYHNYFTRGFEGPFGHSVDAIRMLILFAYIAVSRDGYKVWASRRLATGAD